MLKISKYSAAWFNVIELNVICLLLLLPKSILSFNLING